MPDYITEHFTQAQEFDDPLTNNEMYINDMITSLIENYMTLVEIANADPDVANTNYEFITSIAMTSNPHVIDGYYSTSQNILDLTTADSVLQEQLFFAIAEITGMTKIKLIGN